MQRRRADVSGESPRMPILKRVTGDAAGQIIELKNDLTVIGRSPECHVVLDPNGVSRRHAEIRRVGEAHLLVDLRSRNKTKVNNSVLDSNHEHRLQPGDRINICDVEFLYYLAPPKDKDGPTDDNVMVVTENGENGGPNLPPLGASPSSALASGVRPEVKLKAILEIARNLSSELKIDAVAPKILESLME